MLKNTHHAYGFIAKSFHWLMATLFIVMFTVAYTMINIAKSDFRYSLYDFHKATGLVLLTLVALRLLWRYLNVQPPLPATTPRWQRIAARLNILTLYALMIIMPMTGILTSTLSGHAISFYGFFSIPPLDTHSPFAESASQAHYLLSWLTVICFSLHVLAATYHHYYLKDEVLKRMR